MLLSKLLGIVPSVNGIPSKFFLTVPEPSVQAYALLPQAPSPSDEVSYAIVDE